MYIINLVDSFAPINFGIWNAAVSTASVLRNDFGADSYFFYKQTDEDTLPKGIERSSFLIKDLKDILSKGEFTTSNAVFVSHGCWQFPSKIGHEAAKRGFKWVHVPQGMLEPWSMQQKRVKKLLYYYLVESRYIQSASAVRAVSIPERDNLESLLNRKVTHIPNGIPHLTNNISKSYNRIKFLFMARLHHKKGIIPLIEAWISSSLFRDNNVELIVAGPDDGKLQKVNEILSSKGDGNIQYLGAVYGEEKEALLAKCHFYVLPSLSEGFPTSVLEAMQFGLIPIISRGCNFPEVFINNLAFEIQPTVNSIKTGLEDASNLKLDNMYQLAEQSRGFVQSRYTLNIIAQQQHKLYEHLLNT